MHAKFAVSVGPLPSVGVPVDHVMDVQEPVRGTARHPTAAVTQDHQTAGAFRNGALGASDTDGDAAGFVHGVTDRVATDQIPQPVRQTVSEPVDHGVVDVEVDMDPVTVTTPDVGDRIQRAVGDLDQRISFGGAGAVALEQGVLGFA